MPYIIGGTDVEPHAYATMGEVRSAILTDLGDRGYIDGPEHELCGAVADLSDASGGTIGPLADGYVIDVQHVTWTELDEQGSYGATLIAHMPHANQLPMSALPHLQRQILDAYNAR